MKHDMLMIITMSCGLAVTTALAAGSAETEPGDSAGDSSTAGSMTQETERAKLFGESGSKRRAATANTKPAGTGTAAGYIHDQVQKGNIKIQGATDADFE